VRNHHICGRPFFEKNEYNLHPVSSGGRGPRDLQNLQAGSRQEEDPEIGGGTKTANIRTTKGNFPQKRQKPRLSRHSCSPCDNRRQKGGKKVPETICRFQSHLGRGGNRNTGKMTHQEHKRTERKGAKKSGYPRPSIKKDGDTRKREGTKRSLNSNLERMKCPVRGMKGGGGQWRKPKKKGPAITSSS